jgi:acetyl-CoA C-acetyltransferase/acetyl-CoA acyltransferase 2
VRATELGAHASRAALAQSGLAPDEIDQVVFGNVAQTSVDDPYCARHVGLRAGLPIGVPALTVNRLCGSGFQAAVTAAQEIRAGDADACLVGGTESMSLAPHVLRGARWGYPFGKAPPLEDLLWSTLTDEYAGCPMGITAENLAEKHGSAAPPATNTPSPRSAGWAAADAEGRFRDELAPMEVAGKKGPVAFARDEHPRPETTPEALAKLTPSFKKNGVVTAGNASGNQRRAAALVLTSRALAERRQLTPLARLVGWAFVGVEPTLMGIGPVPAIAKALARTELRLEDMDLIEVNEAFAPSTWRWRRRPACRGSAPTWTAAPSRSGTRWQPREPGFFAT